MDKQSSKIHTLCFFKQYQIFLTAGFDNFISLFSLNGIKAEYTLLGTLQKHQSIITTMVCVENSPMVISADESFLLKVWDIRT